MIPKKSTLGDFALSELVTVNDFVWRRSVGAHGDAPQPREESVLSFISVTNMAVGFSHMSCEP